MNAFLDFLLSCPLAFHILILVGFAAAIFGISTLINWITGRSSVAVLLLTFSLSLLPAFTRAADGDVQPSIGLEPYGTIHWVGLEGESDLGAGVNLTFGLTKNLSLVAFAEGDSTEPENFFDQVNRAGLGLRYTAWLGTRVSLDGGVAGAYEIREEFFFLRLPLGASFYVVNKDNIKAGLRLQYAFDISGSYQRGTATGIASAGPFFSYEF